MKSDSRKTDISSNMSGSKSKQKKTDHKHKQEVPIAAAMTSDRRLSRETANEKDKTVERLQATIDNFLENERKKALPFPSTLSAYERRVVHELSEKFGLVHISQGEGAERHIIVSKKEESSDDDIVYRQEQPIADQDLQNKPALKVKNEVCEIPTEFKQCSKCLQNVPETNFNLHLLQCKSARKKLTKKPNPKPQMKEVLISPNQDEEDLDALLASVTKADNTCHFARCKTSIATLAQTCTFCNLRYCLSHHIPEVHGCGDLAKAHARSQIRKEGKLYSGSGVPCKKPDSMKRAHLQKKLDKKLVEMSKQRTGKK